MCSPPSWNGLVCQRGQRRKRLAESFPKTHNRSLLIAPSWLSRNRAWKKTLQGCVLYTPSHEHTAGCVRPLAVIFFLRTCASLCLTPGPPLSFFLLVGLGYFFFVTEYEKKKSQSVGSNGSPAASRSLCQIGGVETHRAGLQA